MEVHELHPWNVSPEEARQIQRDLRQRLSLVDTIAIPDIHHVAGVDNGYVRRGASTTAFAAVIVLTFPGHEVVETQVASCPVEFPYVPGLLSFREAPAMLAAFRQVESEPDVVLVDAHGYAHPRRLGAASHLGLLLGRPTIGCAKSRLVGHYEEPGPNHGDRAPLVDRGEQVGAVVRTRVGRGPLFVSPGNGVSISTAVEIALACCRDNAFMPEPTRLADRLVAQHTKAARAQS